MSVRSAAGRSAALAILLAACATSTDSSSTQIQAADGTTVAPLMVASGHVHVLLFVTPDCPIANSYAPLISALLRQVAGTFVQVYLVYVDPDLTAAQANQHAREYELDLPLLLDREQRVATALGVKITPSAAVLTAFGLQYIGRIDDRWRKLGVDGQVAEHNDLLDAINAVQTGKPVLEARTIAVGCRLPQRLP
ncbi:MAG: redoxin domain-containing protein [Planctomycetota bacterium]|nr:redoxin domain-containing protein [Planctomycetota bacterium]